MNKSYPAFFFILVLTIEVVIAEHYVTGELRRWHPITFTFSGPECKENGKTNPFREYRFNLNLFHSESGEQLTVPGYFAADGDASESGASSGNKWRAHFTPHKIGKWEATASFRVGKNISVSLDANEGESAYFDKEKTEIIVIETNKEGRDFRGKGILRYVGVRYLRFDNGEYFVKGGADSPENFLGYKDFDGTYSITNSELKHYTAHEKDWNADGPIWHGAKGKGIIGSLNYLAGTGANAFSFLTMNVDGDGQDVWPWIDPETHDRYDVSKLDQWEIVFSHADKLGLFLHFKTQETENDLLLNNGELGFERKLYYRELIARFGHHLALNWNLGEENDVWEERKDWDQELVKSYIDYIQNIDIYSHPVVIHSYPAQHENVFAPLLGSESTLNGVSLQANWYDVYSMTLDWVTRAKHSGRPWIVSNDEQNKAEVGVAPDGEDNNRDVVRQFVLWGNLMAGGAGVEYYFGYNFPNSDLTCNDWRSRSLSWKELSYALTFFNKHVPFWDMEPAPDLSLSWGSYALSKPGDTVVYYFLMGGQSRWIRIPQGKYNVYWYNPRDGGELFTRERKFIEGPTDTSFEISDGDFVMLLKNV